MLDDESTTPPASAEATPAPETPPAAEAPKKAVRRRATKATSAPAPAPASDAVPAAAEVADAVPAKKAAKKAPAKKAAAPRKRATKAVAGGEPPVTPTDQTPTDQLAADKATAEQAAPAAGFTGPEPVATDEAPAPRRRGRAPAVVVTFQPPEANAAPARPRKAAATIPAAGFAGAELAEEGAPAGPSRPRRRAGTAGAVSPSELLSEAAKTDPRTGDAAQADAGEDDEDSDTAGNGTGTGTRRRRRGRRGRGRRPEGENAEGDDGDETDAGTETDAEPDDDDDDEDGAEGAAGTRRRRRRRRSSTGSGGAEDGGEDDVPTVVHVREPGSREPREPRQRQRQPRDGGGAADEDGVRGISGSTRMAAKRVRRQEGRDSGRKRPPILTEAEFLARREAVDRTMVVRQKGDRTQIAVLEDGVLVEHYVTKASATSYAGNVYLGKVQNVLPSMEAAFVDIGKGRNAVLYAGEVNYDGQPGGRSRSIESVLKSGQEVLVQVTKDPIGHKGARLTSQITLPGRYLVYVPEGSMTGISRKLPENERTRLKDILKNVLPEGAGVIIRTAAEGASEEEIGKDVRRLQAQWEVIKSKSEQGGAPVQLHAEPDLVIKVVRDIFNEDFTHLVVQGDAEWDTIRDYVEFVAPDLAPRLSRWTSERDVFAEHRIDEQLLKALDRKVHLPSGGSLVIDRTEAMIVVDVNTGKYVGKGGNLEETVTRNNLEAAEEIARQLRLRDLGGIIVVDFIDMVLESNRDLVVRRLVECLGRDRTKHQVAEVTSLGLVQMTRKRVGQGLLESFSDTCEACNGRGVKVHLDPVEEKPSRGERDRTPKVGPRAPKPGPAAAASGSAGSAGKGPAAGDAEEGNAESPTGGSRNRRRRGGRGQGSAASSVNVADELTELLEAPTEDVLEQAAGAETGTPAGDVSADAIELEAPAEDVLEQAAELAPGEDELVVDDAVEKPVPDLENLPEVPAVAEPTVPAEPAAPAASEEQKGEEQKGEEPEVTVKKRRRAAGRPAGAPTS